MVFDTHLHTEISSDSEMKIEEAIKQAKALNLGLIITEHMDLFYPEDNKFIFDVEQFFQNYEQYRSDKLLLGIEVGMQLKCVTEIKEIIKKNNFDFVLGSIHMVEGIDIYHQEYYQQSKEEAYNKYFKAMTDCIKAFEDIDSLGHIDYIARYAVYEEKEMYYEIFQEAYDKLLKTLAQADKALEINTRRLTDPRAIAVLLPVYKRFKQLGGKYVTIGSDAHKVCDIGANFSEGNKIAAACGLRPVFFKERKIEYAK